MFDNVLFLLSLLRCYKREVHFASFALKLLFAQVTIGITTSSPISITDDPSVGSFPTGLFNIYLKTNQISKSTLYANLIVIFYVRN